MDKSEEKTTEENVVSEQATTIGALIILGLIGYVLLFGLVTLGFILSGKNAWHGFYVPLLAIPGVFIGPLLWRFGKRN